MNIKKYLNLLCIGACCLALLLFFVFPVMAETVFLKDGSIIEGRIISDEAGSLIVRDKKNQTRTVVRGSVMRILYTGLYMGKVYIQKTDGKNVIAYMVDEDRDTYTFRKQLHTPEEFILRRDQVLFIARGNPSGLEGEAGTEKVELKWFPPYNPVKNYRIYIKGPGDRDFRIADVTRGKSAVVKGLRSNKKYLFYVTALDNAGDESLPSNELAITTKNIRPEMPDKIALKKVFAADRKTYTAEIIWNAAVDFDGKVEGYNIYRHEMGMDKPAAKSKTPSYTVKNLITEDDYFFTVKTVDDKNEESADGAYISTRERPFLYGELNFSYLIPLGSLGEIFNHGFGVNLSVYKTDLFYKNLEAGMISGFWMLFGTGDTVDSSFMIPFMASARYRFPVMVGLSIVPELNAGYRFNSLKYMKLNQATLQTEQVTETAFEPAVSCALSADYKFNERIRAFAGAGYIMIFEKDGMIDLVTVTAGVAVLFY